MTVIICPICDDEMSDVGLGDFCCDYCGYSENNSDHEENE